MQSNNLPPSSIYLSLNFSKSKVVISAQIGTAFSAILLFFCAFVFTAVLSESHGFDACRTCGTGCPTAQEASIASWSTDDPIA